MRRDSGVTEHPARSDSPATYRRVLLDGLGLEHRVRLEGALEAARFIASALGGPLASKVGQAGGWDPVRLSARAGPGPAASL